ncbi:MAG: DUF4124 domain-containing protein [Gammaproteobacteria bacterium]|nr:DUF4124 domain-containing protein [Gammaproteobacteria bacterium]MBT8150231.1 DUF4124 domain-containing protein [Gammaproteobacteria bacterium]NND38000.1 DUF4124 domain-containing protein [Pseudomonadales bacterium]NNM10568.1 DUF4124 domain-containing protein [Pseudomonadales bacterium]
MPKPFIKASMRATLCVLFAATALVALPVQAETFYKWKSSEGVWEYGAHPPPGIDAIEIKTTSTKASSAPVKQTAEEANAAGGTLEVEVKQRAKAKKNAEYCETATSNLEALSSKAVIRRRDAEGNISIISEKERKEEIEKAEVAKERYCG